MKRRDYSMNMKEQVTSGAIAEPPETHRIASINGVELNSADESIEHTTLRQRACSELLRQAAIDSGLLSTQDRPSRTGVMSEAASEAIENLLNQMLTVNEPDENACRRYYKANAARFTQGERVRARHVLFAVTPGIEVGALRSRTEACLLELRCESPDTDRFAEVAAATSNCPSGAEGGDLGWLTSDDCAPEFAREIFGHSETGVLPRIVHSRFGLHVVEVLAREAGSLPAFETVRASVNAAIERQSFATSLRQYLKLLAGRADVRGIDLDASESPLVQ